MRMIKGQRRFRRGFLLFPKSSQFSTRWLEWAEWEEEWNGKKWVFGFWVNE